MSDVQSPRCKTTEFFPLVRDMRRFLGLLGLLVWPLLFGVRLRAAATPITVTVTPGSVVLVPGGAQPFTATVKGTTKTTVTWSCASGNGWIDAGTGEYTAPMGTGSYSVKATLNSDPTKVGVATITVAKNIQVAVNKTFTYAYAGDVVRLTAKVTGGTDNSLGVAWSTVGGAVQGAWPSDLDLLVPVPGSYVVSAASVEDPTKAASVAFEVLDPSVITLATWGPISGQPFSLVDLSATVRGGTTQRALWSATGGNLSSHETASGERLVYQLPTTPGAYSVVVSAKDDPSTSVTIPVTVQGATNPTIYGIDIRNRVILPGAAAQIIPYFYAGGSTATLDHGIGSVTNGGVYGILTFPP